MDHDLWTVPCRQAANDAAEDGNQELALKENHQKSKQAYLCVAEIHKPDHRGQLLHAGSRQSLGQAEGLHVTLRPCVCSLPQCSQLRGNATLAAPKQDVADQVGERP